MKNRDSKISRIGEQSRRVGKEAEGGKIAVRIKAERGNKE